MPENNGKVTIQDVYAITSRIEDKLDKQAERISNLEQWKAEITGKLAIIVGITTFVVTAVWQWLNKKF